MGNFKKNKDQLFYSETEASAIGFSRQVALATDTGKSIPQAAEGCKPACEATHFSWIEVTANYGSGGS